MLALKFPDGQIQIPVSGFDIGVAVWSDLFGQENYKSLRDRQRR
jgi:hypothetical protein